MKTIITATIVLLSQAAMAVPTVKTWVNPECATGNCEVKGMKIFVEKLVDKTFTGNMAGIEMETTKPELLAKYGIVQYIKGCHYTRTPTGFVKFSRRNSLGKGIDFVHRDWEVDSGEDVDPVYWSYESAGYDSLRGFDVPRNAGYANANPILTEKYGSWAGKLKNLFSNKLYVTDLPSPATWKINSDLVQNVEVTSLAFKACIYELSKIPSEISDTKVEFPDPIGCLEWSSNFDYDFARRRFVEQKEISPVCR